MTKTSSRGPHLVLALCLFTGALARERALAQFSVPYDPDFASQPGQREDPSSPAPAKGGLELPPALRPGATESFLPGSWSEGLSPFLLLDRPDPSRIFDLPASTVAASFEEFLRDFRPLRIDRTRWNKMREDVEYGVLPREELEPPPPTEEDIALSTGAPRPARPEIEMPTYGTSLSITGRKVIGFSFNEKRFTNDQRTTGRPKSTNLIDITQQLQLRMQGKVGPKITVNVDYDDTKLNKQDISVVYQGDPNEVVQNASFGDIDLSLPATEFVSYNKQLFGIRVQLKYKGFNAIFIGSRTKGTTKTKQFKGNTQFVGLDIPDTSYIRRQYYDLTFDNPARLPIQAGSERVFLSRRSGGQQNVNETTLTVDDLTDSSATFTGSFVQLTPGVDYTVDYVRGILTFKNSLDPQFVVAVDFSDKGGIPITQQTSSATLSGGGTGRLKLVKTFADTAIASTSTETGFNRELKTFYSIGRSQIVRDDGRGNFFLRVLDQNRVEAGAQLNPVQKYPETITVDFENGVFNLNKPFGTSVLDPAPDAELYSPTPITKRQFQVEFRFRLKTFFLEPNLVLQSEVVLIDGVRLSRNSDYFIDYESGFITFFNEERIREGSIIDASYEVAPFSGTATDSLLGTRVGYDWGRHFSIGSTLLYQTGSKPPTVPTVTELARSLLVYEADMQLKELRPFSWLSASFALEGARSHANPNLSKRALIENMEGVKQDDTAGMNDFSWQATANPTQSPADPSGFTLKNVDIPLRTINKNAQSTENETQKVLHLEYDFTLAQTTETSIVYSFSPTGIDLSQKNLLEVTLYQSEASNNEINFHLGGVNEDADGDGILDTEDENKDNLLQPAEDIGFLYNPLAKGSRRYGGGNGRIDSEDLNQNGKLDSADFTGGDFGYLNSASPNLYDVTDQINRTKLDFSGWHTFQIPLNITQAEAPRWLAIKQLRLSVRRAAGGNTAGTIQFARAAVVGNSWLRGEAKDPATGAVGGGSITIRAVNNVDNPGEYTPIFRAGGDAQTVFNDLYGTTEELQRQSNSSNLSEQALEIRFGSLSAGTTVHTRRNFIRALDISQHRKFVFLLNGNADPANAAQGDKVFFLRAGSEKDFFEIQVPITFGGWRKVAASQVDTNNDQIPDKWAVDQGPPGTVAFSTGAPNLQQIAALFAGVYSTAATTTAGALYLNEIHLTEPITRVGAAKKLQADFAVPGWATFGGKHRAVDRNYQTPTTVVSNQDNRQDSAYLGLDFIRFFPMRFDLMRTITITPNANATGDRSNLVSLISQGKVTRHNGTASGNFSYGALPRLSLSHLRDRTEYELLTRLDDRKTYNAGLTYGVPRDRFFLPKNIDLTGSFSKYSVSFESLQARNFPGNFNTDEFTKSYGARLSFVPWAGSSLNPNYSLTTIKEDRVEFNQSRETRLTYPKSLNQAVGLTSNFRLLSWLNPSLNYSLTTIENNLLSVSTFVVAGTTRVYGIGEIKTINRSASGGINLTLSAQEILKGTKLLRSFTLANGYQLQDGDVYNNVEAERDSRTALWIRTPLKDTGIASQRINLTLRDTYNSTQRWSPLEAYDIAGRKGAFKTLAITNNYVQSIQRSEVTGTRSKTVSTTLPDLLASLSQVERLLYADRWMKNGQLNLKYSARRTEVVSQNLDSDDAFGTDLRALLRDRFDTTFSFNIRGSKKKDLRIGQVTQTTGHKDATLQSTFDLRQFRFTPKVDYQNDVAALGTGVETQNTTVITPSMLVRTDISLAKGLALPFLKEPLRFTNRIIWTTTLSMAMRSSPVTVADNSRLFNLNTNADYEIAKNLRMTLNGTVSRLWHKFLKEEDFIAYTFGTMLTFQF